MASAEPLISLDHPFPGFLPLLYDLVTNSSKIESLTSRSELVEIKQTKTGETHRDWDPNAISIACFQSQKKRIFIEKTAGDEPTWVFLNRESDGTHFVRNAVATQARKKASYPSSSRRRLNGGERRLEQPLVLS